jgi:hypothetical protein
MVSIYLDERGPGNRSEVSSTCGGISARWSFGMEVGKGLGTGLCTTSEKISTSLYRGGGTFRNMDVPTIWLEKGGQRILHISGQGLLTVRVTCGCKVLLDTGCGVKEISLLILEGELPEVVTITNSANRDVEVEVIVLKDSIQQI